MRTRWFGFHASLLLLVFSACASDPALRWARLGDTQALARELDQRYASQRLDNETMVEVARTLLSHDVQRFGGVVGERRLLRLSSCAHALRDPLQKVARGDDEVAAAAAFTLVSQDLVARDEYLKHRDDHRALFRAAATWGLVEGEDTALRAARLRDDDASVRRAAIEAAVQAADITTLTTLLSVARRDPDVLVRVSAVRAIATLAVHVRAPHEREDLVARLRDVAVAADEPVRSAVARAYIAPPLRTDSALRWLSTAATEPGPSGIDAAAALSSVAPEGEQLLIRAASDGDLESRIRAIILLDPSRAASRDALKQLAGLVGRAQEAPEISEVAAEQLLRTASERAGAESVLVKLLSRSDRVGSEAALALASVGRREALPRLREDLRVSAYLRPRVVRALVSLGLAAEARSWLTAPDLDVRDAVACALLSTARR